MANMSYCRFHNTRLDMMDCLDALREAEDGHETISEDEIIYCVSMFDSIIDYLDEQGIIEDFDSDAYNEWKSNLKSWSED